MSTIAAKTVAIRGDVAREIAKLKQHDGPTFLIQGSSQLIQTLLAKDLIDEIGVLAFPLVLGKGKRLFGDGTKPVALKLLEPQARAHSCDARFRGSARETGAPSSGRRRVSEASPGREPRLLSRSREGPPLALRGCAEARW